MKTRILTSCICILLFVLCLYIRGWFTEVMLAAVTLIGIDECYRALKKAKHHPFVWGGYAGPVIMILLAWLLDLRNPLFLTAICMVLTMTGCIIRKQPDFPDLVVSCYPLFTCMLPLSLLMVMLSSTYGQVQGVAWIAIIFAISIGGDSAAYLGGKSLGRHLLCPSVSPGKTVEGSVFFFAGSIILVLAVRALFISVFHWSMPGIPACIFLAMIGGFAGQIGDLTASLLKRYSGIKDYGCIFPGHGGVMDRFDSVMFITVAVYCYAILVR